MLDIRLGGKAFLNAYLRVIVSSVAVSQNSDLVHRVSSVGFLSSVSCTILSVLECRKIIFPNLFWENVSWQLFVTARPFLWCCKFISLVSAAVVGGVRTCSSVGFQVSLEKD